MSHACLYPHMVCNSASMPLTQSKQQLLASSESELSMLERSSLSEPVVRTASASGYGASATSWPASDLVVSLDAAAAPPVEREALFRPTSRDAAQSTQHLLYMQIETMRDSPKAAASMAAIDPHETTVTTVLSADITSLDGWIIEESVRRGGARIGNLNAIQSTGN